MTGNGTVRTVESIMDDSVKIREKLEAGTMSNAIARTLLHALTVELSGFKANITATQLGCQIRDHETHAADRLRVVQSSRAA